MKQTAMQLMLRYLEDEGLEKSGAYYKAKHLFEVEAEQIINAFHNGQDNIDSDGCIIYDDGAEQYYNETYKHGTQTKHIVNGKIVLYLEEKEIQYQAKKKKIKAKKYFSKIRNIK